MIAEPVAAYWDASAILSILFRDIHSDSARKRAQTDGVHFLSTLAYAEVCAVIARLKRESILSDPLVQVSFDSLYQGPWRRLWIQPDEEITRLLSGKWKLRGADLWHLAAAKTLQIEVPELTLITFDTRLLEACIGEHMAGG